ncbi:g3238 [Coccomyxa viridis]|uniref:G3238 protein n=1 Tax=Coccomyxa viridis TaxID=1274662 RepID=A0ABP1FMB8_9CHLO
MTWRGGSEEQEYIRREAQKVFRENAAETSVERVEDMAREAETRLEYAVHYGIPYPRLHHAPQFPKRYVLEKPQMPDGPQHATGKREISDKLVAAEARRKAKQEQARRDSSQSS